MSSIYFSTILSFEMMYIQWDDNKCAWTILFALWMWIHLNRTTSVLISITMVPFLKYWTHIDLYLYEFLHCFYRTMANHTQIKHNSLLSRCPYYKPAHHPNFSIIISFNYWTIRYYMFFHISYNFHISNCIFFS